MDQEIERFSESGYFPDYKGTAEDYAQWRKENTKRVVKDIYIADPSIFTTPNAKQTKIFIRLLDKILVSNENDGLFEVLDGVLDLDKPNIQKLADQLQRTTLENIVSTIETLQKRQLAVHKLREIMEYRHNDILETPELQRIIESNTWLFGAQYATLGAEEDTFQNIAKNMRNDIKDIHVISDSEIAEGASLEGINRQVDLFLARKMTAFDALGNMQYKCVIIEIKRPSISLNKKHLQQIDDYAEIIANYAPFSSNLMRFEVILVGRKISEKDYQIRKRMENLKEKGEYGLVSDGRIKCYVKDWFTIFDEFELSNNYLLKSLNTKLQELNQTSTKTLVADLQKETA